MLHTLGILVLRHWTGEDQRSVRSLCHQINVEVWRS